MTEHVTKKIFYHVTFTKPYKTAFAERQSVTIGQEYTPFFRFYEGQRTYPVTTPGGQVIQVPAVKFLKSAARGEINVPNLAVIAAEVVSHYVMLARELVMEEVRLAEFNDAPSRQRCLYAADSLEEAKYWTARIGDPGMSVCELLVTGTVHRADAALLLGDSEPLSITKDRARQYWRGEVSAKPELETLIVGDVQVVRCGL